MAIARYALVALDCPDPAVLAEFYRAIVGGEIVSADHEWVRLRPETGSDIAFQLAPDHVAPVWPEGGQQQAHLDFDVPDLDEGERAVIAVGARKADIQPEPDHWRVFLDPVGHPFCLCLNPG